MRDIHSHVLYELDDGAFDLDESINILKKAIDNGYTDIVLTPHYRKKQGFTANNQVKFNLFNNLLQKVKEEKLNINLFLGNEITIDDDIEYNLKTKQVLTLNNSKYLLIELPFNDKLKCLDELIDDLLNNNYIPIIAHPERYKKYNEKDFIKFIDKGVLLQGNIESLYNKYGRSCKNKLISLLKHHMIHFMGSDIHSEKDLTYERNVEIILNNILHDDNLVSDLCNKNILRVINNLDIKPYKVLKEKFKLLNK